jgi:hypothetical protein
MLNFMKNRVFKKYLCVFVCFLLAGNVSQGVVVCFGSDGHVAVEGAFHEDHCGGAHSKHSSHKPQSLEHTHGHDEDCHPCVDIRIPAETASAKASHFSQNCKIAMLTPLLTEQMRADMSFSIFTSALNYTADSPYFTGLRTVIILC